MDTQLKGYLEDFVFRGKIVDTKRGRGGLIFIVQQAGSNSKVAFKTVQEFEEQKLDNIERFNREAKNWFSISSHPMVITPFYIEKVNGFPLICMPYCEGDLRELIDSRPSLAGTLILSIQIIKALLAAKARGMKYHQDIKPENILYQDLTNKFKGIVEPDDDDACKYMVRLADFGVVNAWDDGHAGGTNCYKAPEQYDGTTAEGFEPDIFAVGVIMAELYQGYHPATTDPETGVQKWRGSKLKKWAEKGLHHFSPSQCDSALELLQLIKEMLHNQPSERPCLENCYSRLMTILGRLSPRAIQRLELTFEYYDYIDAFCETQSHFDRLLRLATIDAEKHGVIQILLNNISDVVEKGINTNEELVFAHHISKGLDKFINDLPVENYLVIERCTKQIIDYVICNESLITSELLYPRFAFKTPEGPKLASNHETKTDFLCSGINRLKSLNRFDLDTQEKIDSGGNIVKACLLMSEASKAYVNNQHKLACELLEQVIALVPPEPELTSLQKLWYEARNLFQNHFRSNR